MTTLSVDIETYSSIDLIKSGVYAYVEAPDFEILLFGYAFDDEPVRVIDLLDFEDISADVMAALTNPAIIKTAYNANFERVCIAKHFKLPMLPEQWRCTSVHALMLGLPGNLDGVAKCLNLNVQKDAAGKALIKYFTVPCKPTKVNGERTRNMPGHDPVKWARFISYCGTDVEVERTMRGKLIKFTIPDFEQHLWELDQRINDYGVRVDGFLVSHASACDKRYQRKLESEAIALTGLDNPNSVAQLKRWLFGEEGVEVKSLTKETVPKLLEQTDSETVRRVLELRQEMAKTSITKYQAMKRGLGRGDRVRGLLQFYGANRTGRWAGRLVQVQNLPKNVLPDLALARGLLQRGEYELIEILFDSVPSVLSQLIRTAFIPSHGCRFIVADFSAIEARVIAWLAGEKWRMEVFNGHGKIYEASASQMFKVPLESITKGNPLRAKGKIAELALGFQGGVNALIKMGALDQGLTEGELKPLVDAWRLANPAIKRFWFDVERAAITAVKEKRSVKLQHGLVFSYESGGLFITLPSGRRLAYVKPRIELDSKFDKDGITYEGVEQGRWCRLKTYGGKLVENCLAGDTWVLTDRGWIVITEVRLDDLLWDGLEWVSHKGVIEKGEQETIEIDGARVTPDHLVLTERGWLCASSCEGHYRAPFTLPDGYLLYGFRWEKIALDNSMRLWTSDYDARKRIQKRKAEILRMPPIQTDHRKSNNTRHVQASGICGVAIDARPMQIADTPSLAQLRCSRDSGLPGMGKEFQSVLGGYGSELSTRPNDRTDRSEWELRAKQLHVGNYESSSKQQTYQYPNSDTLGRNDSGRGGGSSGYQQNHPLLSAEERMSAGAFILEAGRNEPVYDILNAGPRRRFTVVGESGPMIVHNCVQAIARDCLAESMMRLDFLGYRIVMHVHDEVVIDEPLEHDSMANIVRVMGLPIDWAPGLPLQADAFETEFYKKDD